VSRTERLRIAVGERSVAALLVRPRAPRALYALAHGAGAGMTHRFLEAFAGALADRGVATLRYQFPYAEAGRRRPDPRPLLLATVRAAVAVAAARAGGLTLLAGGTSMGGRMTSVAGLVFAGFPLHPARRPGIERAEHLDRVALPMLFLAGTRDALAELPLLRPVCARLAGRAELHVVDGADHGFAVLRRSGRTGEAVTAELADAVRAFADRVARA
jgi:predicted alpha/beta-hydrolase family hydrolase